MTNSDVCLDIKNVGVTFRSRKGFFRYHTYKALQDVSFQVLRGETLGIIGRNGCGKSTLLKVLAGILSPDSGSVIKNVNYISLQSLAAGFENQLSGKDNAILSAMLLGHSLVEARSALPAIRDFSELAESFNDPVKTYSSGMKARLGFSIAMLMEADVLLIDETLGVGDSRFRQKAEAKIRKRISSDQTVVFVSHQASQVKRLCNRVVWLENGKLMNLGVADKLVDEYELFIKDRNSGFKC